MPAEAVTRPRHRQLSPGSGATLEAKRRSRHDPSDTKTLILDTVEELMLEEGYAAVSTRRVAKRARMTAALVHYYYPTTDALLVAAYQRTTEINLESLTRALMSQNPIRELWALQSDRKYTALAMEFMALANHRKAIRDEIKRYAEYSRRLQAEALSRLVDTSVVDTAICPPVCMSMLMVSVARTLITEGTVGISLGHPEARTFMNWLLEHVAPPHGRRRSDQ